MRPALRAARAGGAGGLAVPGLLVRIDAASGAARRAPTVPVLRVRDRAFLDHLPATFERVLDKLVAQQDILDGGGGSNGRAAKRPRAEGGGGA